MLTGPYRLRPLAERPIHHCMWGELLSIARWTPSPHNCQPWKVRVEDDRRARVFLDHARALPKEDASGCFCDCAMGSYIESLRLLAANRGLSLGVSWCEGRRQEGLEPFADLELAPGNGVDRRFADELFLKRRTSRLAPSPDLLSGGQRESLRSIARESGQELLHFTDRPTIDRLMDLNLTAVVQDLNSRDYHDEIVSWFRYRETTAQRLADGLSARCMAIPPLEFFCLARAPWTARLPVVGSLVRRAYARRLGPVPQLAALTGPFWDRRSAIQAGACLMRLWLEMTRFGLFIHPFGNLVTNLAARSAMFQATGSQAIWIVFRLGRTAPPPRSHRLTVEAITCA